jgi:hypothetical protein
VAEFDKAIPPGREGTIKATIDGKKLFTGMFEKNFTVNTNDPENKQFVLTVQGTVQRVFELSREMKWSGFTDDELKLEVNITNLLTTPIHIKSVRWADDVRGKELEDRIGLKIETVEKGKKYLLKIWKKKELRPDNVMTNIILTTDFPKLPEKAIPMSIVVQNDVQIYPDRLYFGEMVIPAGATKPFDRTFNIVAARGDSLKILKALPSRDDMTVKIQELQPGKSFRGTVWVRPETRLGQYAGSIKIYTNYPKYKELILDIVGSVRVGEGSEGMPPGNTK